jgi:nitrilase
MRIGIWQTAGLVGDPAGVVTGLARQLEGLTEGLDLVVCPELWTTGYNAPAAIRRGAEPADGPTFRALSELARRTGVAIAYGYPEQPVGAHALYNAAQLIGADGAAVLNYRKLQLWGEAERALFVPGAARVPPVDYRGWKVGFAICYDTEFPETTRYLALMGAELVLAPTALATGGSQIPELIIPTRAIENHLYIAFANRCGEEDGLAYLGGSCIIGPDGAGLARADSGEALIVAELDRNRIPEAAARNPYLRDIRRDLQSSLA